MPPRDIVFLVADSLRYDAAWALPDAGLPWTATRALRFHQARAAGCWTLPAHAGMFSGLLPHAHGATEQSRDMVPGLPLLAGILAEAGWSTHMVTANTATTHVFGLDRGFSETRRIWKLVPTHPWTVRELLVLAGKPRLRKRLFSRDALVGRLAEDLEASKVWFQRTAPDIFQQTGAILRHNRRAGKRSFCFLNLMETHFPYHVGPGFAPISTSPLDRAREIRGLYHLVNQTWLTREQPTIAPDVVEVFRERQRRAWALLAPEIDAFIRDLATGGDTLVVFCSDHGDAFGEQDWLYHFANATDAGFRIPLLYLSPDHAPADVHVPVSACNLYESLLRDAGHPLGTFHLGTEPARSLPVMESFWYDNQGRTLERYRYNQFGFVEGAQRYLLRRGRWYAAPPQTDGPEPRFEPLPAGTDPLAEIPLPTDRRAALRGHLAAWEAFCARLPA